MLKRGEQVDPLERWPSGDSKPIGMLHAEPEELGHAHGLAFSDELDDLDYYKLAAVRVPEGDEVWLIRYANAPEPGTVLYADRAADARAVRESLLGALGLSADALSWTPDES